MWNEILNKEEHGLEFHTLVKMCQIKIARYGE